MDHYPAEDYALILWDHGGGSIMGYGQDTRFEGKGLSLAELTAALSATPFGGGKKLGLLGFDACLMSTIETAAMLEPFAERLVASEESEWDPTWDFSLFGELRKGKDLASLGEAVVSRYEETFADLNAQQTGQFLTATLAEMDLSKTGDVRDALDALSVRLASDLAAGKYGEIERLLDQVREIDDASAGTSESWDLLDLQHFAEVFSGMYPSEGQALVSAVDAMVLHSTSNVEHDNGVSVLLPRHSAYASQMTEIMNNGVSISDTYSGFLTMRQTIADTGDVDYWKTHEPPISVDVTPEPTEEPTPEPTEEPTPEPTEEPTPEPTEKPTPEPTEEPTPEPTETTTPEPTETPTPEPTETPTPKPTPEPTEEPTPEPTETPTPEPTEEPTPEPTEEPTPEISAEDAAVVVKLTEEQKKNAKSATYTIFRKYDKGIQPLLINMRAQISADGEVMIPGDVRVLTAKTDRSSGSFPWVAEQTAASPGGDTFRIRTPMLVSGPEFTGVLDQDAILLKASVKTVPDSEDVQITNLSRIGEKHMPEMLPVDFTEWDGIAEYYPTYTEKREGGKPVPFSLTEWETNGTMVWRQLPYEDDFGFRMTPLADLDGDYACQVVIEDIFGKQTASELQDLALTRAYTEETASVPGGTVTYRVYEDHAELAKCGEGVTALDVSDIVGGKPVTRIAGRACAGNTSLLTAVIPAGVTEIGGGAFSGCTSLTEVTFSEGLERVDHEAFRGCTALTETVLHNSVRYIGWAAFMECSGITDFRIPSSLETLSDGTFIGCSGIRLFSSDGGSAACQVRDGVVLSGDGKKLIAAPLFGVTYYKVPEGVEEIGYGVFASDHNLKRIDFPASLKKIGNYAFYDCPGLLGITLPEGLESIGTGAFGRDLFLAGRKPLASVDTIEIGSSVSYIGTNAFAGVGASAFRVADGNETFAAVGGFLTGASKDAVLEAPAGLSGTVEVPDGIVSLKEEVFEILDQADTFVLPDSLQNIPEHVFPYKGIENGKHTYDITVKCSPDSAAAAYAKENGIRTA